MNIVINATVDDGSLRAAAILQTQNELHQALAARSSRLGEVACLTLVQTSVGVRTLFALVDALAQYADSEARLAALIEQARRCGLSAVSDGLGLAWRIQGRVRMADLIS